MIYEIADALQSLKPNKQWVMRNSEYSGLEWLDSSTAPTESEINAEVTRLTNLEPARLLRVERDARLAACDWRASSDLTLADAWKAYRQSLRDLPASASPKVDTNGNLDMTSVTWPTIPS